LDRLYRRTTERLRRRGWPRRPNETPHEYARRLQAGGVLVEGGAFQQLTDRYAAARFGGQPVDAAVIAPLGRALAAAISQVRRA
jgi:hypothetical protein